MPVETAADLRRYIEENLIRVGMQGLAQRAHPRNEGFTRRRHWPVPW